MKGIHSMVARRPGPKGRCRGAVLLMAPLLTAFLLGLVACKATETVVEKEVTDREITAAVQSEFWFDDAVDANQIDVTTLEGIVTLSGTVNSLLAAERAVRITETTVGVRGIVDRIEVVPAVSRSDRGLEAAVRSALIANPATESFRIGVEADDGVVTLSGTADSWHEKQLASTVAKGVKGVRGIRNDIRVEYEAERADREIQEEVKARLENDVLVDDVLVSVRVDDGKVTLKGTVGSLAEKTRAITDAWVAGVKAVEADELEVEWWMRDKMRRTSAYVGRSDEEIERAVRDAFVYDPRVSSFAPDVAVEEGTVTLSGVVDNLQAKMAAGQDARNVTGVWRVRNQLKVRPETLPSDSELKERVARAFREDPYLERREFGIRTLSGWVYLTGRVDTSWERNHAARKARSVKGVVRVVNNVHYDHTWEYKPDWEILEDVKDQLFWSPFVDEDEVNVRVQDGVATLSGNVETWGERHAAENNAYEGGAKDVKNELTVTHRTYGPFEGLRWYPPLYPG